jgi:hypothetical protein
MSLNAANLNFGNMAINNQINVNDKVYNSYSLEEIANSVLDTSTINSYVTPINNNITDIKNDYSDEYSSFTPYYFSSEIKTDYYHFANDLSYVIVPPNTTCMIQANLIFSYGYNIPDPSAQSHNIFINYGCSKTLLSQPPYVNSGVNTADVFSNTNIIPFSFNQKILHYKTSRKCTPMSHNFFYENTTDTSQNIYLFGSMQQYYNATPTRIVGKLVCTIIKNNAGTNYFTYNTLSTTYNNLSVLGSRKGYTTYNSPALSSIVVPANSTKIIYNAISFKLSKINAYDNYGVLQSLNYYFGCSYSSTTPFRIESFDPLDFGYFIVPTTSFHPSWTPTHTLKIGQLLQNKETSPKYIFDSNSFIYKNDTGQDVTLYLQFGIYYNTTLAPTYYDVSGQVTGTMGAYTLTNSNSTSTIYSTNGVQFGGGLYPGSAGLVSYSIKPKKRYLKYSWAHFGSGDIYTTNHFTIVGTYNSNYGTYTTSAFYPDINIETIKYINDNPEMFIPNSLNSIMYEGKIGNCQNIGMTLSNVCVIDATDLITNYGPYEVGASFGFLANFPVATWIYYLLIEIP